MCVIENEFFNALPEKEQAFFGNLLLCGRRFFGVAFFRSLTMPAAMVNS